MNVLLLKMGGSGTRFGDELPKQFHEINGEPLFCYILRKYLKMGIIDKYIIVTNGNYINLTESWAKTILGQKLYKVVIGGETSAKSSKNGVIVASEIMKDDDVILFHDATNPIVVTSKINYVINAAKEFGFASLGSEQVHAIYNKDENDFAIDVIDKKTVCSGYSPEAFKFNYIYECFSTASDLELNNAVSAISLCKFHRMKTKLIVASFPNLKITYKEDYEFFKLLVKSEDKDNELF